MRVARAWLQKWGAILGMIACSCAWGGHWVIPQAMAWGKMLVTYTAESSLGKAVVDTFSGRRPCKICHEIKSARRSDPVPAQAIQDLGKSDPGMFQEATDSLDPELTRVRVGHSLIRESWKSTFIKPEVPPPRG